MTETQMWGLIGGLVAALCVLVGALLKLESKLARIERQNDRQLDMIIALLQRNGIDPVNLNV
jgi:hypothetical protein